ncbi:endo alpha-1,4 polygalactosaminidase [Pseudoalteromonas sp. SSDWG2]|uniref:endo alpha-1,4 polygalactosaminidase n=1 Tax=Pseudoalteromonas sp. SSDWG2 TaxID=3139391 RepID=UPI003BAA7C71
MRSLHYCWLVCFSLLFSAGSADAFAPQSASSIAFYYADIDTTLELSGYERVVVDPQHLSPSQMQQLKDANTQVWAYLSIGEAPSAIATHFPNALLGYNEIWQANIMDASEGTWRQHLIQRANTLRDQGYDGVFLDTLDSHALLDDSAEHANQQRYLVSLINEIHAQLPIILNRGFDIYPQLAQKPQAIVAESLFNSYDYTNNTYVTAPTADSQWLISKLNAVKDSGIEAIVIDYLGSGKQQRIAAAQKISASGFTPYVSDALLTQFGVSTHYPIPKRVLGFYDSKVNLQKNSECHKFLSTLIEYYGYVPQCIDIHNPSISNIDLERYAAVIYWLPQASYDVKHLRELLLRSIERLPTTIIGQLPQHPGVLSKLGVKNAGWFAGKLDVQGVPLEFTLPGAAPQQLARYQHLESDNSNAITLVDEQGNQGIGAAKMPWGVLWLEPLGVHELMGDRSRWPVNPLDHLMPLIDLPTIPVADVTSESGLRIFTAHIDGDGFPSLAWLPGKPFAGKSILDNVIKKYPLPHTVSVIEAEVASHGLYPDIAPQLETVARDIFTQDNVELASHTFSHPFFWDDRISVKEKMYGDSLPVENYELNYDREVFGSVRYINERLAPRDKQVKVFLWSGAANPTPDVIRKTSQLGIYNVNGGNTFVLNDNFSLSQVYPHINSYQGAVQVYAPVINENLYTQLWTENMGGFSRVWETFELLEKPHRLKPVNLYYHMYSGVYPASLKALESVYSWVNERELTPLYLSEYAQRAQSLYQTSLSRSIFDDAWYISTTGVRSMRLPPNHVPSGQSEGVVGTNQGPDGNYISLASPRSKLVLTDASSPFSGELYLQKANAIIEDWQSRDGHYFVTFLSHEPLSATFDNAQTCNIMGDTAHVFEVERTAQSLLVTTKQKGRFTFTVHCTNAEATAL